MRKTIAANNQQFIDWYNDVQPIGLRQHQLDLLSGIGDICRETIIDERRLEPFADVAALEGS